MSREDAVIRSSSVDDHPWDHPFHTPGNIARFRAYSDAVHAFALDHARRDARPLSCAFAVNMAQNMYKWATMAQAAGWPSTLIPHPQDHTVISQPEWEEFDGEFGDMLDGDGFLAQNPGIPLRVPVRREPMEGSDLWSAYHAWAAGNRGPLLRLLAQSPQIRDDELMKYAGFYPYYAWAKEMGRYDVGYATSIPAAAYFSGRPYCVSSVGGDLQYDAGRGDQYGELMVKSFNGARFLFVSNPHTLGHSRRLGLTNGVYLPYPMDTDRYRPAPGQARARWEQQYGKGVYVLTTARLDGGVKGHTDEFLAMIMRACRARPELKFIFLRWGAHAQDFAEKIAAAGLSNQLLLMSPVGKVRLIDYYRSCDVVLDQFVFGYYGATALEAAACGKPVIMKLRDEQYGPLYAGDVAPVVNAATTEEIYAALIRLASAPDQRLAVGKAMREWVVRTHGDAHTTPRLLALLRLAAGNVPLPGDLVSPLLDAETAEETAYHTACLRPG